MNRAKNLLPAILEMDNLYLAFWNASKGKRYSKEVLRYQSDLDENLELLQEQIAAGQVAVGDYRLFLIYEPKKREICASAFKEQVLHHALMNICHHYFDQSQVDDSYASRKGRGTYAALDRAKRFSRRNDWYLKLDVRKFFASIHHNVLKEQLARRFKEKRLHSIFYQIIDSYEACPDRGLPIGNLTSQYFANHSLSGLDHFIKEQLKVKAYVRYMDDMILWSSDKDKLQDTYTAIQDYVQERLLLELKPKQLNHIKHGLPFLGYRVFAHHVRLLQQSKVRFARKMGGIYDKVQQGEWDETTAQAHVLPLIAFTSHADADLFRKQVIERYTRSNTVGL